MRTSAPRLVLGLTLPLLLFACGQGPAPQASVPPGQAAPLPAGAVPLSLDPGANSLYYEPILAATNGWGPIEIDHSNGEQYPGDGKTLTLNGKTYGRGFGAHAYSELRFALKDAGGATCTRFTADVGVDDEVGPQGSVAFQVFVDGQKVYDSGVMTGASATRRVDVPVTGQQELRMVVTDGGDGTAADHADWATPLLYCQAGTTPPAQGGAGTFDASFNRINPGFNVADTAVQPDGKIVAFGLTEGFSGPTYTVARYNSDGSMDTAFGSGGSFFARSGQESRATAVTVQPDGKIVALGTSRDSNGNSTGILLRLLPNGQFDLTLGNGATPFATRDLPPVSTALAVQPDGRIIVAGGTANLPGDQSPSVTQFVVVRLLPTGQLDPSFGSGGRVATSFLGFPNALAQHLVLQPDGKIVAGGVSEQYDPGVYRDWQLVRYLPDGALDPTFDGDGRAQVLSDRFQVTRISDLELQADGKFLAIGGDSRDFCRLTRVNTDGSLDTAFRDIGNFPYSPGPLTSSPSIAVQADQKVVVGGCDRYLDASGGSRIEKVIFRLDTGGLLDTTFGNTGFTVVDDSRNVLLQPDGKIVAGFNPIVRLFP